MRESHHRNNTLRLAKLLSPLLLLLLCNPSYGQLRGNLDVQAVHSTNVEGLDSASPDNIVQPLIDVRYTLPVDRTSFTIRGRYQPNYFLKETKRSFHYGYLALTGGTIFSGTTEASSIIVTSQIQDPAVRRITNVLESISQISRREMSIANASSTASTIYALKELLLEEGYSETMKEVIIEEVEKIKNNDEALKSKLVITKLDELLAELNSIAATEDNLYLGTARLSHAEDDAIISNATRPSSAMLIIPDDIGFNDISHNNLYIREDLFAISSQMNAPRLSVTLESELQENSKTYSSFSYHTIKIHPNFTTTISGVLLGSHYYFTTVNYPNDTLYTYTEHRLWGDMRFEITSGLASVSSIGIGFRNNPYPLQIHIRTLPPNPIKIDLIAQSKFTQLSLGTGVLYSMSKQMTIGLFGKLTVNPNIDSSALSASSNQANKFAGPLSSNTYAYDKYGAIISLQTRLPLGIDLGATFDYEHHGYPAFKFIRTFNKREIIISTTRSDDMYYTSGTISKPFFLSVDKLIGLFTAITPIIDLTYSKLSSSISSFSYEDFTASLNISLDF